MLSVSSVVKFLFVILVVADFDFEAIDLSFAHSLQIGMPGVRRRFFHSPRHLYANDNQVAEQAQTMLEERVHHQPIGSRMGENRRKYSIVNRLSR